MNKNVSIIVGVLVVVAVASMVTMGRQSTNTAGQTAQAANSLHAPQPQQGQGGGRPSHQAPQQMVGQKLNSTPFAQFAYLISTSTYDAKTKQALTGFNVSKKTLSDGSLQITLAATNPEYHNQEYTVKPGQQLYFIERSLGDDNGSTDTDHFLGDDTAVLVDQNGTIIQ